MPLVSAFTLDDAVPVVLTLVMAALPAAVLDGSEP